MFENLPLEAYHAWLAGDDSKITQEMVDAIKEVVFSPEADMIHSIAQTELGATP